MSAYAVARPAAPPPPPLTVVPDRPVATWEEAVCAAEEAVAAQEHARAIELLREVLIAPAVAPRLALRAFLAEAWARMTLGGLDEAAALLDRARDLVESPTFSDADRAEVLYRLGAVRLQARATANSVALLTVALQLADGCAATPDQLRVEILERRARAYQRMRDWDSARQDLERALELAGSVGDPRLLAHVYFATSNVAQRQREWLLARFYGEHALSLYRSVGDRVSAGKVLNNLGIVSALLGRDDEAVRYVSDALALAEESGNAADAGYAACSLARLALERDEALEAEAGALRALDLLGRRRDHVAEAANAYVVLARARAAMGRHDEALADVGAAERLLEDGGTASQLAAAWVARGDLAAGAGDAETAASLYRRAAERLQDVHF